MDIKSIKIAKRYGNNKRKYLIVNAAQAKHIPVSPGYALEMMRELGDKLSSLYSGTRLVIGFAETATAIGAEAASRFGNGCRYVHTTRENKRSGSGYIEFMEEHSHAVEQRLCTDVFDDETDDTPIIIVDDELTTGKTIINVVSRLKTEYPFLSDRVFVAASLINRLSAENEERLAENGIKTEYLIKLPESDYEERINSYEVTAPEDARGFSRGKWTEIQTGIELVSAGSGCGIKEYTASCCALAECAAAYMKDKIKGAKKLLVLGTEECMYPALKTGRKLELDNDGLRVYSHSTTRSPIGVSEDEEYPINNGYMLSSFYDKSRTTYIYNLDKYDAALIVTDSANGYESAANQLSAILEKHGCGSVYLIGGGKNARHI